MARRLPTLLAMAGFLLIAGLAYVWANGLMDSLNAYRSPLREESPAGAALAPLSEGVTLVIVDGLRLDTAGEMPFLNELAGRGAEAVVLLEAPSYSETTWTTIVSGASPQISGAPPLNEEYATMRAIEADHLFAAAHDASRKTAISGYAWWEKMVPAPWRDAGFFEPSGDAAGDARVAAAAIQWLESSARPDFLLIHFSQVDLAGDTLGPQAPAYREAALAVDAHLRDIAGRLDLSRQTLIVVADHGQANRGGHGGSEPAVLRTRLVAAGQGIAAGQQGVLRQADIAPTLAALLGTRIPTRASGHFAESLLAWDEAQRDAGWAALAAQRSALAGAYLRGIGARPAASAASGDAMQRVGESNARMSQATSARLQREQLGRLWIPALVVLALALWYQFVGHKRPVLAAAALLAIAGYYALYLLSGLPLSFSAIASENSFLLGVIWRTLAGLLLGWAVVAWLGRRAGDLASATWAYGGWVILLLGAQIAFTVWQIGPRVGWMLPDFELLYVLLMTLIQTLAAALGSLVLAGVSLALPRPAAAQPEEM